MAQDVFLYSSNDAESLTCIISPQYSLVVISITYLKIPCPSDPQRNSAQIP